MITVVRQIVSDIIIYTGIFIIAVLIFGAMSPDSNTYFLSRESSKPMVIEKQ